MKRTFTVYDRLLLPSKMIVKAIHGGPVVGYYNSYEDALEYKHIALFHIGSSAVYVLFRSILVSYITFSHVGKNNIVTIIAKIYHL